jgi:hypothetical protein
VDTFKVGGTGSVFGRVVGAPGASTLGEGARVWRNYDGRAVVRGRRVGREDAGEGGRGRKVDGMLRGTCRRGWVVVALENGSGGDGEVGHAAAGGRTAIRRGFIRVTTNTYRMFAAVCCLSHTFQPGSLALLCAEPGVNPALLSQLGTFSSLSYPPSCDKPISPRSQPRFSSSFPSPPSSLLPQPSPN